MSLRYIIGVFRSYRSNNNQVFEKVLYRFSIFEDKKTPAKQHLRYIQYVLNFCSNSRKDVVAIIGDNCAVNRFLGNRHVLPLIGYAIHRIFNPSIKDKLDEQKGIIKKYTYHEKGYVGIFASLHKTHIFLFDYQ